MYDEIENVPNDEKCLRRLTTINMTAILII